MKRKVVKQGSSTFMVSLPSKWAKTQGISKGQEVNITESDDNLVISTTKEGDQKKSATLEVTSSTVHAAIVHAYRCGYDSITIKYTDESIATLIMPIISNHLIGFDINKQGKNYSVIENITEPTAAQFEVLFKKVFYNISLLIDRTLESLKEEQPFADYEQIMYKIYQYDNFCRRIVSKQHLFGNNATLYWTFCTLLMHGQRELFHFNRLLQNNKYALVEIFEHVKKSFDLLKEGYFKNDLKSIEQLHNLQKQFIHKDLEKHLGKDNTTDRMTVYLSGAIRNFFLASSPMVGLLLHNP